MIEYVCGFLFDVNEVDVVLIRKLRPQWQCGLLNGVGGHIEPGETPYEAMCREFLEETGVDIMCWRKYTSLEGESYRVHFFYAHVPLEVLYQTQSMTDELVEVVSIWNLTEHETIPNLKWLIPMALSMNAERAELFAITEVSN